MYERVRNVQESNPIPDRLNLQCLTTRPQLTYIIKLEGLVLSQTINGTPCTLSTLSVINDKLEKIAPWALNEIWTFLICFSQNQGLDSTWTK